MVLRKRKNLVFTSAGDNSNLSLWVKEDSRSFDLCIVNYSDRPGLHSDCADIYFELKGGKFPNLKHIYDSHPDILDGYEAIWVTDDDIIISTQEIDALFAIRSERSLLLLQPAFSPKGKISHAITTRHLSTSIRYTNFVEITCPLFEKNILFKFLDVYDSTLVGWGVDWWFLNVVGEKNRIAISDDIYCINPKDYYKKGGKREIVKLQNNDDRIARWTAIKIKYGVSEFKKEVFSSERKSFGRLLTSMPGYYFDLLQVFVIELLFKLRISKIIKPIYIYFKGWL